MAPPPHRTAGGRRRLLVFALALALGGAAAAAELTLACTTFPVWQIAQNVTRGAQGITLDLVVPAVAGCPHDYEPTAADLRRLDGADVLLVVGMGLDRFALEALDRIQPATPVVDLSKQVQPVDDVDDHDRADAEHAHSPAHDHGEDGNPHWFAGPLEAGQAALYLAGQLLEIDPANAGVYAANADKFAEEMKAIAAEARDLPDGIKLAVLHDAFGYFARDAGVTIAVVIEHEPGVEPSIAELNRVITAVRDHGVTAVAAEPQYPAGVAELVAKETGLPLLALDPVASGPADAGPGYYAAAMRKNVAALKALKPAAPAAE